LFLTEPGLGSCIAAGPVGYADIIKAERRIDGDMEMPCTVAVGFEDADKKINT
jgi:hypothetical protein